LDVTAATTLCLPSFQNVFAPTFPAAEQPAGLDHFKCYSTRYAQGSNDTFGLEPRTVRSLDLFGEKRAGLGAPLLFCSPAEKTRNDGPAPETTPISNADAHLVCFRSDEDQQYDVQPWLKNQFGTAQVRGLQTPNLTFRFTGELLCLPSTAAAAPK
jgi:hypothetical protein